MASDTGGVKPMSIQGRMARERERLIGMTDEERAWRKQWVKDQELSPNEPRHVPELIEARLNPIRKFYRYPLDTLFKPLVPVLGEYRAGFARYLTGKFLIAVIGIYTGFYYFKYHTNDWTTRTGWRVIKNRRSVVIGDAEYPKVSDRSLPSDYASRGFKDSPI
ncbi:NADH dehydrogenase [ubiquinone] 1 beta subcomplex subunit 6 [Bacillus rossius redtenbacheri]|uniref:NADH dehydrogenase [ubiquinone] 1 beta subcomplex subunit 6 n=1 Tax=Bacillus rossius redtenbacheri TaxID=93214 RepID=UPI002FDD6AB5